MLGATIRNAPELLVKTRHCNLDNIKARQKPGKYVGPWRLQINIVSDPARSFETLQERPLITYVAPAGPRLAATLFLIVGNLF